jgi:hypothetical protein
MKNMRNLNLEAAIWYFFTSVEFIEDAARECDEVMGWLGKRISSKGVENFGRNGQVFDTLKQWAKDFKRAADLAGLGDYELAWNMASSIRGDVRGMLELPFYAWMTEQEYQDFFSTRVDNVAARATRIENALNNAMTGAESFLYPDADCPERSNDDDGYPGDEIASWYRSYFSRSSSPLSIQKNPSYRVDTTISCKTGDEVPWTGVWYPSIGLENHSLTFAIKGLRMQPVYRVIKTKDESRSEGAQIPMSQTVAVDATWHPVIADIPPNDPQDELRAQAGQACPKAGIWQQVDTDAVQRRYEAGEEMANLGSAYGFTVWRWVSDD